MLMAMTEVQRKLLDVLADLKGTLRDQDRAEASEATRAGEPGVALEVVCQQLFEYDARVPRRTYAGIEAVGRAMNMPEQTWKILEPLVVE